MRRRADPGPPSPTLWRHRDFRLLWGAQTVSQFGSQVSQLAIPLTAALTLDATPFQMGLLWAVYMAPFLAFGLVAGVWVDRRRRRPTLIITDVLRALVLLVVPVAALLDLLRIELLYAVIFLAGALTLFFDVAYGSYLPSIVDRDRLAEGNAKLETSRVAARIAGPSVAGLLVRSLTGPVAVVVDAATYLASAAFLARIATPEPPPPEAGASLRSAIGEGLHVVASDPILRATTISVTLWNVSDSVLVAVYVLFATRDLGLGAGAIGVVFAAGNVGGILGAFLGARAATRLGPGPAIVLGALVGALGIPLVALAAGPPPVAAAVLVAAQVLASASLSVAAINTASIRQALVPHHLLGRVNATVRFASWGLLPVGSLVGGLLGTLLGLRATIAVGALLAVASFLAVWFSPVRTLRTVTPHPAPVSPDPLPLA